MPNDDFRVRAYDVGPLRWDRANRPIVDAKQKALARTVIPLAHTDELLPA